MEKYQRPREVYENVEIIDAGSEGKAVARVDNLVIFISHVVPGDIVDIEIIKKKKSFIEGRAIKFHKYSEKRAEVSCKHFGVCGGCKWQNMDYLEQLFYKQKQVEDNLKRIGKIDISSIMPIIPSEKTFYYRNKLEYTFSCKRWLLDDEIKTDELITNSNALGFHVPTLFDRVVDITKCYLQKDPSNLIRNEIKKYALENNLTFYDARSHNGFLRNLIIRTTTTGDLMVILIVRDKYIKVIDKIMTHIGDVFPKITSLMYVVNGKKNDTINDLEVVCYKGDPFIIEKMKHFKGGEDLQFKIGPKSFFQTNSEQANNLYKVAAEFADFCGDEIVYDLYTGTGTIANYIANSVKKVIGIESVPEAIEDAYMNSVFNNITNAFFYSGDMMKVLNDDFVETNGKPDIIITDPPRAGMHEKVINQILTIAPMKVVYISCNPATQARDIALMSHKYDVVKIQPVDMFPHTHHVENVVLLHKK